MKIRQQKKNIEKTLKMIRLYQPQKQHKPSKPSNPTANFKDKLIKIYGSRQKFDHTAASQGTFQHNQASKSLNRYYTIAEENTSMFWSKPNAFQKKKLEVEKTGIKKGRLRCLGSMQYSSSKYNSREGHSMDMKRGQTLVLRKGYNPSELKKPKFSNQIVSSQIISSSNALKFSGPKICQSIDLNNYSRPKRYRQQQIRSLSYSKTLNANKVGSQQQSCKAINTLLKQEKYSEALRIAQKILAEHPHHLEALEYCGMALFNLKAYRKARQKLVQLFEGSKIPKASVYIILAICCQYLKQPHFAQKYISQCLLQFPDYAQGYLHKGKYLMKRNQKEAIKCFLKCLSLNSDKRQAYIYLAQLQYDNKNYVKALQYYTHGLLNLCKRNIRFLVYKGHCHKALGCYSEAYDTYQKFLVSLEEFYPKKSEKFNDESLRLAALYEMCYILYKKREFTHCLMKCQDLINASNATYMEKAVNLIVMVEISRRDFYQAEHAIQRAKKMGVRLNKLTLFEKFSEGAVLLMKKKVKDGLRVLQSIRELIYRQKLEEFAGEIYKIYHMFTAYGYFRQGQIKRAYEQLQMQRNVTVEGGDNKDVGYNECLCQGILRYREKDYEASFNKFKKALEFSEKPQPYFYLLIVLSKEYIKIKGQENQKEINHKQNQKEKRNATQKSERGIQYEEKSSRNILQKMDEYMRNCLILLKDNSTNFAAQVFYYQAILSCQKEEWRNALVEIDEAIQKSQDNCWKFFYLRGLILSLCNNFKQAINEASVAISLDQNQPLSYLLRSKCLQIQGNGSQAFLDLQTYIALEPDDPTIHKYAGQLLFQNGAFQDALLAYNNINLECQTDFDVFLTRGKTYFLLGKFSQAKQDLSKVTEMRPEVPQFAFDYRIMGIIEQIFNTSEDNQQRTGNNKVSQLQQELLTNSVQELKEAFKGSQHGKIFKMNEFHLLSAVCDFYLGKYQQCIECLKMAITCKLSTAPPSEDDKYQEEDTQKELYVTQMHYNIALAYLMLSEYAQAEQSLLKCSITEEAHNYQPYFQLLRLIRGESQEPQKIEIYSVKNKLSRYLPLISVPLPKSMIFLRLCVPYPKVEPPEINPTFDSEILGNFDVDEVERKPEAPWILKEADSIKFTDKIEMFSRLDLGSSEASLKNKAVLANQSIDSIQDLNHGSLRQQLKLDWEIEAKLGRLLGKKNEKNTTKTNQFDY